MQPLPTRRRRRPVVVNGHVAGDAVSMSGAFIVLPDKGRLLDLGNLQAEVLASAEQTSEAFTLLKTKGEPPGFGPPLHRHRDSAEAFFVLEGEYLMFIDKEQRVCPAGSFVYVPRGTVHTFKVVSAEPGTKRNLFTPAGMVRFFEDSPSPPPTEKRLLTCSPRSRREARWRSLGTSRIHICEFAGPAG